MSNSDSVATKGVKILAVANRYFLYQRIVDCRRGYQFLLTFLLYLTLKLLELRHIKLITFNEFSYYILVYAIS